MSQKLPHHPVPEGCKKTPYRRVTWDHIRGKWRVALRSHGLDFFLDYFLDPVVAAKAGDYAAKLLQGPDAAFNFDGEPPAEYPAISIELKLISQGFLPRDYHTNPVHSA